MRTTCRHRLTSLLASACLLAACTAPNPEYQQPTDGALPDLVTTPSFPFIPSHIGPEWFTKAAASITLQHSIDTSALTVDGLPAPPGTTFVDQQGLAVLAVKSLVVPGQAIVRVRGTRPLVIVAGVNMQISGILDGSGHIDEPGPGGFTSDMGQGAGHKGNSSPLDTGGSGGGHGGPGGAAGGVGGNCGQPPAARVNGGSTYGDASLTNLFGGSGGGSGAGAAVCPMGVDARGGGGGGAIQLTAADSITLSGAVNVGGGGGKGGCKSQAQIDAGSGGGGGGSGGSLLLEARIITLGGFLAANGGGGGGGAFYTQGGNGADAYATADSASGGAGGRDLPMGGQEVTTQRGGLGGAMSQGGDSQMAGNCGNSGGGGGGTGRIYLRSAMPINQGLTSPPATIKTL